MFDLQKIPKDGVQWVPAQVTFDGYEDYKEMAEEIAEYINNIELTDENVKDVKKVLADARKVTDGLDKERIRIKKEVTSPIKAFETQVKDLISIIDNADTQLRAKIREIEEAEREAKKNAIIVLWGKRASHYKINNYFPEAWEMWLTPQHLNKSMSMKAIETDMTEWLEETESAFETLEGMDDEYEVEYLNTLDLATAIKNVNERNKLRMKVASSEDDVKSAHFIIKGEKDIKLAKMLLDENKIEYITYSMEVK